MARGGAREGAGRKAGAATRMNEEARTRAAAGGVTPLDYLLGVLRDETKSEETRIDVAKAAAPYMHARLNAVTVAGDPESPMEIIHKIERVIVRPENTDG